MSNPLDVAHGFGPGDIFLDILEELHNSEDPLYILIQCEEADEYEGWTVGTSLEIYYRSHDNQE